MRLCRFLMAWARAFFGTDRRCVNWPCGLTSDLGILLVKPLRQPDFATHTGDDAQVIQPLRHISSRRWPTLHTRLRIRSSPRLPTLQLVSKERQAVVRKVGYRVFYRRFSQKQEVMQPCGAVGVGCSSGSIAWSRWTFPTNLLERTGRLN